MTVVRERDVPALSSKAQRQAAEIVARLYGDPFIGEACDPEHPLFPLRNCYKVKFDETRWAEPEGDEPRGLRPDYRLVYRLEPNSEQVEVVAITAIAHRADNLPYQLAQQRLANRDRPPTKRQRR